MIRVLVVDDEADVREVTVDLLNMESDIEAVGADEPDARRVFHDFVPDVCLVDLTMPGHDGLQFAAWVKAYDNDLTVILYSAYPENNVFAHMKDALRIDAWITKPTDHTEIVRVIREKCKVR